MHKDQLDMLTDLKGMVAWYSNEGVAFSRNFEENSIGRFSDFDHCIDVAKNSNETFKYWGTFIYLMQKFENLVRADRDGDWVLHLQTVQALLPIFAAFVSTNYLRLCSLYLEDMHKLADTAPEVYNSWYFFCKANTRKVQCSRSRYGIGADNQKVANGCIWNYGQHKKEEIRSNVELSYHEILAISNLFRQLSGVKQQSIRGTCHQ